MRSGSLYSSPLSSPSCRHGQSSQARHQFHTHALFDRPAVSPRLPESQSRNYIQTYSGSSRQPVHSTVITAMKDFSGLAFLSLSISISSAMLASSSSDRGNGLSHMGSSRRFFPD